MNKCKTCKNCCTLTLVRVLPSDITRWKKDNRYDIILCLEKWVDNSAFLIHKRNGECIFLTKKGCEIYPTRPQICRDFPKTAYQKEKYGCVL